jgi:hypothetical protein
MKKLIPGLFRWVSKSTPALAMLVVAAGATGAYALGASTSGGGDTATKTDGPSTSMAFGFAGPAGGNLSDADRTSLEAFGTCMKDNTPQPGDGTQPPDPADGKAKFDAAFDKCKSNLSDTLQQKFEAQQKAMDEYQSCLDANGAPKPPSIGQPPSKADIAAMEKARKACADKLPDGAGAALCVGGPGGPGGPGGHGGPPGMFGMAGPPPPPGSSSGSQSGSSSSGSGSNN